MPIKRRSDAMLADETWLMIMRVDEERRARSRGEAVEGGGEREDDDTTVVDVNASDDDDEDEGRSN